MAKKVVRFIETASPYQKGEIAGFEPEVANKLIEQKVAVEYKKEKSSDAQGGTADGQGSAGSGASAAS